jgi:hypothetical protein
LSFILGGEELNADFGYGPPRMFAPGELQAIAKAIEPIDAAEIAQRYAPARMMALEIYPGIWDRKDDEDNLVAAERSRSRRGRATQRRCRERNPVLSDLDSN